MATEYNKGIIGVDIGGSHITAGEVVLEERTVRLGSKNRKRVDSQASAASIINDWQSVLGAFINEDNREDVRIGIAMPGPFDYEKGISYIKELSKYDSLYGINVKHELASVLNIKESSILLRNDAEAFLHGEIVYRGIDLDLKVVGVTLGTGLGSAVSKDGQTRDVFRAITPMKQSISEEYLSTRWFLKRYKELCGGDIDGVEALLTKNDLLKNRLFDEFSVNLAVFLDDFVNKENASVVVIGGNIARCLDLFLDKLKVNMENKDVVFFQSALWEDAALLGAACLWEGQFSMEKEVQEKK